MQSVRVSAFSIGKRMERLFCLRGMTRVWWQKYRSPPAPAARLVPPPALIGGLSHVDYSRAFAPFEAAGGKWVPTFNLLAFLIGPIWYLLKGMWLKAVVLSAASFFLILVTGGLAALTPWLYYGFFGNWDLYLWERRGKQGW